MNRGTTADLAVVIVAHNDATWLERCLSSIYESAGTARVEVIVVDNASTDGTREVVESSFPEARVLSSPNLGFAYGNNRGIEATMAPYVLLLNPDTEIVAGTLGELIGILDARPWVGLVGVRQVTADGTLWPTMRRFPSPTRAFCEALFSVHWPVHPAWSGERVPVGEGYEHEGECDWPMGSFMLARREAVVQAGMLDERFFLYSEEPDLCLRIRRAGWQVWHLPQLTIVHHAGKGGLQPRLVAQEAHARKQYAEKNFHPVRCRLYVAALILRHLLSAGLARVDRINAPARREGAVLALATLTGRSPPPFGAQTADSATDPEALARFYDEAYSSSPEQGALYARWRTLGAIGKADHVIELCAAAGLSPASTLDVGCGDGALLSELRRRGFGGRLEGLEVTAAAVEIARGREEIDEVELYDGVHLPAREQPYDLGILSHVLEHVGDPAALLAEVARRCRAVVVEVPLEANASARRAGKSEHAAEIGHLQRLDRAAVAQIVARAGLERAGELEDPLPLEVHRFFAETAGARARARAKWALRTVLHRFAPALARRAFTVHYACLCRPPDA